MGDGNYSYVIDASFKVLPGSLNDLLTEAKKMEQQISQALSNIKLGVSLVTTEQLPKLQGELNTNIIQKLTDFAKNNPIILDVQAPALNGIMAQLNEIDTKMKSMSRGQLQKLVLGQGARLNAGQVSTSSSSMPGNTASAVMTTAQMTQLVDLVLARVAQSPTIAAGQRQVNQYSKDPTVDARIRNIEKLQGQGVNRKDIMTQTGVSKDQYRHYTDSLKKLGPSVGNANANSSPKNSVVGISTKDFKSLLAMGVAEHGASQKNYFTDSKTSQNLDTNAQLNALKEGTAEKVAQSKLDLLAIVNQEKMITLTQKENANRQNILNIAKAKDEKSGLSLKKATANNDAYNSLGGQGADAAHQKEMLAQRYAGSSGIANMRSIMQDGLDAGGNSEAIRRQMAEIQRQKDEHTKMAQDTGANFTKSYSYVDPTDGTVVKESTVAYKGLAGAVDTANKSFGSFGSSMVQHMLYYHAMSLGMYGMIDAFNEGIRTMTEYELEWTRLSTVLEQQGINTTTMQSSIYGISQDTGANITTTAKIAQRAAQTRSLTGDGGDKENNIAMLTRAATMGVNISGEDIEPEEFGEDLNSILLQTGQKASAAPKMLDMMTYVQNTVGANVKDQMEGLKAVAAQGKLLGADPNFMLSMLGSFQTQSGESGADSGTMFQTFLRRITATPNQAVIKENTMGTDGQGIEVMKGPGQYKDLPAFLQQLYQKYSSGQLSQSNQIGLEEALGFKQLDQFQAFMQSIPQAMDTYKNSSQSVGAAELKNNEIMATAVGQWNKFKETVDQLMVDIGSSGLLSALTLVLAAFNQIFTVADMVVEGFNKLPDPIKDTTSAIVGLVIAIQLLNAAMSAVKSSQIGTGIGSMVGSLTSGGLLGAVRKVGAAKIASKAGNALEDTALAAPAPVLTAEQEYMKIYGIKGAEPIVARATTGATTAMSEFGVGLLAVTPYLAAFALVVAGIIAIYDKWKSDQTNALQTSQKNLTALGAQGTSDEITQWKRLYTKSQAGTLTGNDQANFDQYNKDLDIKRSITSYGHHVTTAYAGTYQDASGNTQTLNLNNGTNQNAFFGQIQSQYGNNQPSISNEANGSAMWDSTQPQQAQDAVNQTLKEFNDLLQAEASNLDIIKQKYANYTDSINYASDSVANLNGQQAAYTQQIQYASSQLPYYTQLLEGHKQILSDVEQRQGASQYQEMVYEYQNSPDKSAEQAQSGDMGLIANNYDQAQGLQPIVDSLNDSMQKGNEQIAEINEQKMQLLLNSDKYLASWDSINQRLTAAKQILIDMKNISVKNATLPGLTQNRQLIEGATFNGGQYAAQQYSSSRDTSLNNYDKIIQILQTAPGDKKTLTDAFKEANSTTTSDMVDDVVTPLKDLISSDFTSGVTSFNTAVNNFSALPSQLQTSLEQAIEYAKNGGAVSGSAGYISDASINALLLKALPDKTMQQDFTTAANTFNVPVDILKSIGAEESGLSMTPKGQKSSGAWGVMQLEPATAKGLGVNRTNEADNIYGGAKLLSQNLAQEGGDMTRAIEAYYLGAGNLAQHGGNWIPSGNVLTGDQYAQKILNGAGQSALFSSVPGAPSGGGGSGSPTTPTVNNDLANNNAAGLTDASLLVPNWLNSIHDEVLTEIQGYAALSGTATQSQYQAQAKYDTTGLYSGYMSDMYQSKLTQTEGIRSQILNDQSIVANSGNIWAGGKQSIETMRDNLDTGSSTYKSDYKNLSDVINNWNDPAVKQKFDEYINALQGNIDVQTKIANQNDQILLQTNPANSITQNMGIFSKNISDIGKTSGSLTDSKYMQAISEALDTWSNGLNPDKLLSTMKSFWGTTGAGYSQYNQAQSSDWQYTMAVKQSQVAGIQQALPGASGDERDQMLNDEAGVLNSLYSDFQSWLNNIKTLFEDTGTNYSDYIRMAAEEFGQTIYQNENMIAASEGQMGISTNQSRQALLDLASAEQAQITLLQQQRDALTTAYDTGNIGLTQLITNLKELRGSGTSRKSL